MKIGQVRKVSLSHFSLVFIIHAMHLDRCKVARVRLRNDREQSILLRHVIKNGRLDGLVGNLFGISIIHELCANCRVACGYGSCTCKNISGFYMRWLSLVNNNRNILGENNQIT